MSVTLDPALLAFLENAANRLLRLDSVALARLAELEGKTIRLQTTGADPFAVTVRPEAGGVRLSVATEPKPDVTLTGDLPVFFRFVLRRFFPDVVAAGEVQISGDIELGQRFHRILEQADVDWEEQTARVLGDVPARQLGNLVRGVHAWMQSTRTTLRQDLEEYLLDESRLLPRRGRVTDFRASVERLQRDLDALEQRLARLRPPP